MTAADQPAPRVDLPATMDEVPFEWVLIDADGIAWQVREDDEGTHIEPTLRKHEHRRYEGGEWSRWVEDFGPVTVLYRPDAPHPAPVDDAAVERAARALFDHRYDMDDAECSCGWTLDNNPVDEDGPLAEDVQVTEHMARVALAAARAGEAEPIRADRCDNHPDPTTRTWGAYRTGEEAITVQTTTGEHVTDSDADWVARTLNAAQSGGEAVDREALIRGLRHDAGDYARHVTGDAGDLSWDQGHVRAWQAAEALAARGDAAPSVSAEKVAEAFCEPRHRDPHGDGWPLVGEDRYCGRCIDKANAALGIGVRS